jgi:hypothetical protein
MDDDQCVLVLDNHFAVCSTRVIVIVRPRRKKIGGRRGGGIGGVVDVKYFLISISNYNFISC